MAEQSILRGKVVWQRRGKCRSAHYADIQDGLFVRPFEIGKRARGYAATEVDALIAATIAGKSDDEIRALVKRLEAARSAPCAT